MAAKRMAKPAAKKKAPTTAKKSTMKAEPTWEEIEALVDEVKSDASAKPKRKYTRKTVAAATAPVETPKPKRKYTRKAVAPAAPASPPPILETPKPKRKYTRKAVAPTPASTAPVLEIPAIDRATKAAADWAAASMPPDFDPSEKVELVFSFDTTGSMYPCLTQVRRNVQTTVRSLFKQIPNLRIGVISHGDYCDGPQTITSLDLTSNPDAVCQFVERAPNTGGGDMDECYELALNTARTFSWTSGHNKAVVLIGDCEPHEKGYRYGGRINDLDWRNELGLLLEAGIKVYPVQALGRSSCDSFYDTIARKSGVPKLTLPQFSDIEDIICALCYQRAGRISEFEETLRSRSKRPSFHVSRTLATLTGKVLSARDTSVRIGSRFQVLELDSDCSIRDFVISQGLEFKKGRGFYQFTKSVFVQPYKEVIAQDKETGEILYGDEARKALGIPMGDKGGHGSEGYQVKPERNSRYIGFIQSTSVNRRLLAGTKFLYEISEVYGGVAA